MAKKQLTRLLFVLAAIVALMAPALAQSTGPKVKATGVILKRDADNLVLRLSSGAEQAVKLTGSTEIKEKKGNPFRSAKKYAVEDLLRGLKIEAEGRPEDSGVLVAEKVRFTNDDYEVSQTVESRVTPVETQVSQVETQVSQAETRITQSEENARRLAGQIDELHVVSNAARGGAKAAQETADAAVASVQAANERITAIDQYEPHQSVSVHFKVGSALLTPEAKTTMDEIAAEAKNQKGFVIEVTGFASSDGSESFNRRLSHERAEAVVRYLAEMQDIPLRRIIIPYGYGESRPVADNSRREGRQQNRRVEVRILVSRGLTTTADNAKPTS